MKLQWSTIFILANLMILSALQYDIPHIPMSVYTEDIDLDGDKDVIIGHRVAWEYDDTAVSIFTNIGNGYLNPTQEFSFYGYQYDIFCMQANNDEYPDLVTFTLDASGSEIERYVRIINNDSGIFDDFTDIQLMQTDPVGDKTFGDVNDDGMTDIVVSSSSGQFCGVIYNEGENQFSEPEYFESDGFPADIACGKLNEDSRDDIVVSWGGWTKIYFSYETGFECYEILEAGDQGVKIIDIDNDGDNDIVSSTGSIGNLTTLRVCENIGSNEFINHGWQTFSPSTPWFYLCDLNNDDLPDFIYANSTGIYILYNEGNLEFSQPQQHTIPYIEPSISIYPICCEDLDGNNYNDIILAYGNYPDYLLYIIFNDGTENFIEEPVSVSNEDLQLTTYELTNYPNPFNPTTEIRFQISDFRYSNPPMIEIYNAKGQLVDALQINQDSPSPVRSTVGVEATNTARTPSYALESGLTGSVTWNASEFSSGIYFYKLNIVNSPIKKMVLIK
jgi:hypothetical protein